MPVPQASTGRLPLIARLLARPQAVLLSAWHGYFACEPDWVVLTTRGRKSGLPREVLRSRSARHRQRGSMDDPWPRGDRR